LLCLKDEGHITTDTDFADFCAGTGMYSLAASYFEPKSITAFEYDSDAIEILK
jgi:predicted RNA methylase